MICKKYLKKNIYYTCDVKMTYVCVFMYMYIIYTRKMCAWILNRKMGNVYIYIYANTTATMNEEETSKRWVW